MEGKIEEAIAAEWMKKWEVTKVCPNTRHLVPNPSKKLARMLVMQSGLELKRSVEALTEHSHTNKHLFKMKIATSPICEGCSLYDEKGDPIYEKDQTPSHLAWECDKFRFQALELESRDDLDHIGQYLAFFRLPEVKAMFKWNLDEALREAERKQDQNELIKDTGPAPVGQKNTCDLGRRGS